MSSLAIRRWHTRYRAATPPDPDDLRAWAEAPRRLALPEAADTPAIICVRRIQLAATVHPGDGTAQLGARLDEALEDALAALLREGPAGDAAVGNVLVWRDRRDLLADMLYRACCGDLTRAWAWRQLGLLPRRAAGAAAARRAALAALAAAPEQVWPVFARLILAEAATGSLTMLMAAPEDWAVVLPIGDADQAIADPDALDPATPGTALPPAGATPVAPRGEIAIALLAWAGAQPLLARQRRPALAALLALAAAGGVPALARVPATRQEAAAAIARALAPVAARPAPQRHAPAAPPQAAAAPPAEPHGPLPHNPEAAADSAPPAPPLPDPAAPLASSWAGLLFLIPLLPPAGLLARLEPAAVPRAMQALAEALGVAAEDPAIRAFCGGALPEPGERPEGLVEGTLAALEALLRDRLGPPPEGRGWLVPICRRDGLLRIEPGWIEAEFPLAAADPVLRRAAIDLDPGYVPMARLRREVPLCLTLAAPAPGWKRPPSDFGSPPRCGRRFGEAADPALARALDFPATFAAMLGLDAARLAAARAADPRHPLDRIGALAADGALLAELALLACLPELHEGFATLCRLLHREARPEATVALALDWLEAEAPPGEAFALRDRIEALLLHEPVAALGVLRCDGDEPWHGRALRPGPGLWAALNARPPLLDGAELVPGFRTVPGLDAWLGQPDTARALAAARDGVPAIIALTGETAIVRATRLRALLGRLSLAAVRAPLDAAASAEARGRTARDAYAVALLHTAIPWLDLQGEADAAPPLLPRGLALELPILVTAAEERAVPVFDLPILPLRLAPLPATARRRMWSTLLPQLAAEAGALAARYPVDPEEARGIVADLALRQATGAGPLGAADIAACLRARTATYARPGVRRLAPRTEWHELLLPPTASGQLAAAVRRVQQQLTVLDDWGFEQGRGDRRGVRRCSAARRAPARRWPPRRSATALGLDLLVVDLAARGLEVDRRDREEPRRGVRRGRARRGVLLFDEADALFGKRTEVSDAHDRYANIETAYLLQRLERFEGVAILATNLRGNLDAAFLRRIDVIVAFAVPDAGMRARLWRLHLPQGAPLAPDVALGALADAYALSGAQIRNAALGAAYLAAAEGVAAPARIAQRHLLDAIAREFREGRPRLAWAPAGPRCPARGRACRPAGGRPCRARTALGRRPCQHPPPCSRSGSPRRPGWRPRSLPMPPPSATPAPPRPPPPRSGPRPARNSPRTAPRSMPRAARWRRSRPRPMANLCWRRCAPRSPRCAGRRPRMSPPRRGRALPAPP